jgi:NAD dependent epimerase/dehydratase family enzyme
MILVVGATGLVGNEVCRKVAQRGEKLRALVRASSWAMSEISFQTLPGPESRSRRDYNGEQQDGCN